jgi:hypothetical protein
LGLNTLKWAKAQGALAGPAHSGWGLEVDSTALPNFTIPPFNGIGANEYIVDVTHDIPGPDGNPVPAVDFLSTVDTPYPWELNIWYQTLNAGFRTRISGETDFPCIYSERVGLGRSYVKLAAKWTYEDWCEGIRAGKNYVSDGLSHLIVFRADVVIMGEGGSQLSLPKPAPVIFRVRADAMLEGTPKSNIKQRKFTEHPFWHVERARIGGTRTVPVELIQNGFVAATTTLLADGTLQDLEFKAGVARSSWVAIRILPSSHTNPIFVEVGNKPIRAFRRRGTLIELGVQRMTLPIRPATTSAKSTAGSRDASVISIGSPVTCRLSRLRIATEGMIQAVAMRDRRGISKAKASQTRPIPTAPSRTH